MNDETQGDEIKKIEDLPDEDGNEVVVTQGPETPSGEAESPEAPEQANSFNNGEEVEVPELTAMQAKVKELKSLLFLLIAVLAFRSTCFEPFRIPSGSMIPTLMIGDFILVNKMSYGFKVPFTDLAIGDINWNPFYLFGKSDPERGDVVVFKYPQDPATNYIKRVIGLPGDKIEIRNKVVHVNGNPIESVKLPPYELMSDMDEKFKAYNLVFYKTVTGEHDHIIQFDSDNLYQNDFGPQVVPPNNFFVMGDNRDFSADSRSWGFVPRENIKGKAMLVWLSMIFPGNDQDFKFRGHRIGTLIDNYPQTTEKTLEK